VDRYALASETSCLEKLLNSLVWQSLTWEVS
jgi:hypothetical protein